MKAVQDQRQITKLLDRYKSTSSRWLNRISGSRGYRPKQACELSAEHAQNNRNAPTFEPWEGKEACSLLCMQWSPEQIATRLPVSFKTLYRHVYADKAKGGALWKILLRQRHNRKRYVAE